MKSINPDLGKSQNTSSKSRNKKVSRRRDTVSDSSSDVFLSFLWASSKYKIVITLHCQDLFTFAFVNILRASQIVHSSTEELFF